MKKLFLNFGFLFLISFCFLSSKSSRANNYSETKKSCLIFPRLEKVKINGIADVFKQVDTVKLQLLIESKNEVELEIYLAPVAVKIAQYIYDTYNEDVRDSADYYCFETVTLGLFCFAKENNLDIGVINESNVIDPDRAANCFISALSGLLGLEQINTLYHDFQNGVSFGTIKKTLKTMLRRVAWGITIGITVFELVLCIFDI
jgi:hypothetical protein